MAPKQAILERIPGYFPLPLSDRQIDLSIQDTTASATRLQLDQLVSEESNKAMRSSLFQATLALFEKYLQLYASTPALAEVFESTLDIVTQLDRLTWHSDIKVRLKIEMQTRQTDKKE